MIQGQTERKPAIFLDRDGVLCKEKSYIATIDQMEIFPYTKDCIMKIKNKGYYAIVITNQSGVARGLFTEADLRCMNQFLQEKTDVDAIYYCPHHPTGIIDQYKKVCRCRKPGIELLKKAEVDFRIDMAHSYMVGDRASDIRTGQNAEIRTILLESGYGTARLEEKVAPDYVRKDLRDILDLI